MRTLYQLKEIVEVAPSISVKKVPTILELIRSGSRVVDSVVAVKDHIFVFENGYVGCITPEGPTVFPLHESCKDYRYVVDYTDQNVNRNSLYFSEEFFDNNPWPIRVIIEACERIEHNHDTRPLQKNTVSFDAMAYEIYSLADERFNALTVLQQKEFLNLMIEGLKTLTAEQKEVLIDCVIYLKSLTDIANQKKKCVQSISEMRDRGLNNMRRVFISNGYDIPLKKIKYRKEKPKHK